MTEKKDKYLEVVIKLIKLTQEGKIEWRRGNLVLKNVTVKIVFITEYKGKSLRLYEYEYEVLPPPPGTMPPIIGVKKKYPYRQTDITLEFIDDKDLSLWEFPHSHAISDLLHTVKYQVAGVDDFLDSITSEE